MTHLFRSTVPSALLMLLAAVGPAKGQEIYTFTDVADTRVNGVYADLGLSPNVNPAGVVAFTGQFSGGGASGVFTGSGGSVATVASSAGGAPLETDSTFESPRINAANTVVFRSVSFNTGVNSIFANTGAGGALVTVADNRTSFADVFAPALNAAGQVGFTALSSAGGSPPGVFRGSAAGGAAPVTIGSAPGDFTGVGSRVFLNGSGTVAFVVDRAGAGAGTNLLLGSGPTPASVVNVNTAALGLSSLDLGVAPHVSDNGQTVTFLGTRANGSRGVFQLTLGSTTLTPLVETADGFFSDISAFSLAGGRFAFLGTVTPVPLVDPDGTRGLFNGANPVLNRIVEEGDLLNVGGNLLTVSSLGFTDGGLNASGQVAFYAGFADTNNTSAIFRADVVPEPGSTVLLLAGAVALGSFAAVRRRRQLIPAR